MDCKLIKTSVLIKVSKANTFEVGQADVGEEGYRKPGQLCHVLVRPDIQTTYSIFLKNPDRIRTANKIDKERIRTNKPRTVNPDKTRQ